jgi:hypothetical protein
MLWVSGLALLGETVVPNRILAMGLLGCAVGWPFGQPPQAAETSLPVAALQVMRSQPVEVAPLDIQAAETEGAAYPHGDATSVQSGFDASADVGTAERKCVDTRHSKTALSGDFLAGPFDDLFVSFRTHWQQGHTKVWWAPRYLADRTPRDLADGGLVIRGTRLDGSGESTTYRYGGLVRSIPSGIGFFNSGVWVPSAGRWMLVATYGSNWAASSWRRSRPLSQRLDPAVLVSITSGSFGNGPER